MKKSVDQYFVPSGIHHIQLPHLVYSNAARLLQYTPTFSVVAKVTEERTVSREYRDTPIFSDVYLIELINSYTNRTNQLSFTQPSLAKTLHEGSITCEYFDAVLFGVGDVNVLAISVDGYVMWQLEVALL